MRNRHRPSMFLFAAILASVCRFAWADPILTTLTSFNNSDGSSPNAGVILDSAGNLYGTTYYGGAFGNGTVFELAASASTPTTLIDFNGANGAHSQTSLVADAAGNLYGTTYYGGSYFNGPGNVLGDGTVFRIAAPSNTFTSLASFDWYSGRAPASALVVDGAGNLFGTTTTGGASDKGVVFEIPAGTNTITPIASFNGSNGTHPGSLVADSAGNLYGTTAAAGADNGTVFKIAKGTTAITTIASFNGSNGSNPSSGANLIIDSSGNLFGTTISGGANNQGTVFEIAAGTSVITTLATFNGSNGASPAYGSLIADAVGNLYGTTEQGGASGLGTAFKVSHGTNSLSTLVTFYGTNGANPDSGLIADAAGNLYGTTRMGGGSNNGTVFKITGSGFVPAIQIQKVIRTPSPTLLKIEIPTAPQVGAQTNFTVPINNTDPNSQGLLIFSGDALSTTGTINRNEPTIVLTHGWNDGDLPSLLSNASTWQTFAQQYAAVAGSNINIVAWNWSKDADTLQNLGQAASRTLSEGTALGEALVATLGPGYNQNIHFIGHSLGTMVNAQAVNVFEAHVHDNNNTQVTILDDAEVGNEFTGTSRFAPSIPAALVARIDNYVSAFGMISQLPYVANVMLDYSQSPTTLGLHNDANFHGYPIAWYESTMLAQNAGAGVGYGWSIDANTPGNFPTGGATYFQQIASPGNPLSLLSITSDAASTIITQRNNAPGESIIGNTLSLLGLVNLVSDTVQSVGGVIANLEGPNLTLQIILGGVQSGTPSQMKANVASTATASPSPSCAWVQIHIPSAATFMSFDFTYASVDPSDLLFVGVNDTQIFALEGAYVPDGITENSGLLDVSNWSGQDVELFVEDTGVSASGMMTIGNIQFQSVPEPRSLGVLISATLLFLRRRIIGDKAPSQPLSRRVMENEEKYLD